jgi:hypothetical protein
MLTVFESLYDLAIEIQLNPNLSYLTVHGGRDRNQVEAQLQSAIAKSVMFGERIETHWHKVRIFCRNYVNRAIPFTSSDRMLNMLHGYEQIHSPQEFQPANFLAFTQDYFKNTPKSSDFIAALYKLTSPEPVPALQNLSYLEWLAQRWLYWVNKSVQTINANEVLSDVRVLSFNEDTKLKGAGLLVAANYFADMGLTAFAKPDLHVLPLIRLLTLEEGDSNALKSIIRICQAEDQALRSQNRFNWITNLGGLWPRYLDRIIYLTGSDNHLLNGVRNRQSTPERIALMRRALIQNNLVTARYAVF